ncbi:kinase-like domain-containing protein [Fusarium venenatum]|uniref:kinase-like domain-containing protein n=1 Tax=Fusarium venenatum TaxID=56646 RepID=UPI001E11F601|nr:kinase-like domain-containing protein [Fusarium venenatum]
MEYLYTKYAILTDYEPVTSEEQTAIKDLVALEARVCELLMKNPHPNIVKYWGCYVVDGRIRALCFSKYRMTLKQRIDTGVPFDTQSCVKGIRDGILHLHSLDLIHNDINPYNIMIGPTDNPVIIDFDSCKREGERLVKMGTPGWFDENSKTAVPENDFYGLRKI